MLDLFSMKKKVLIIIFFSLLLPVIFVPIWAFFIEPNLLIVRNIKIKDSALKGLKVAYLSDLHICQDGKDYLLKIIKKVNDQKPDIILLGGDYIVVDIKNNKTMSPKEIATHLKGLKAKYGIFMVMGNHEAHLKAWKIISDTLKDSDIKILQNANIKMQLPDKTFYVVGIADFSNNRHNIAKAFKDVQPPVIAFTHSPDIFPYIPDYVNITLAGHSHGGQVYIPFYGPLEKPRHLLGKYIKGLYEENGKKMFVSSGIGNSHYKVRMFNLPEIIILDFK